MKFDFEQEVISKFGDKPIKSTIREVYNPQKGLIHTKGVATDQTNKMGVYALYEDGNLMKIGKAVYGGIFKRMGQYYRGDKTGGLKTYINKQNRDNIVIKYFNLKSAEECWAAERYLQAQAFYYGESMLWEDKSKN